MLCVISKTQSTRGGDRTNSSGYPYGLFGAPVWVLAHGLPQTPGPPGPDATKAKGGVKWAGTGEGSHYESRIERALHHP